MRKQDLIRELKACKIRLLEIKEWINCVKIKPNDKKGNALKKEMLRNVNKAIKEIDRKLE
jgi:hypothetical protein